MNKYNKYDNVYLDVADLLKKQVLNYPSYDPNARSGDGLGLLGYLKSKLRLYFTALLYKTKVYKKLIYSNIKLDWFYEFHDYWVNELGNRPINPHDFYFLFGVYRQKFQEVKAPDSATDEQHLKAWQDPRNVYLLFANQYKLALHPLSAHRFIKYIPKGGNLCEYGCGFAPITTSLCKFYPYKNVKITCADIPTIMLHFIRWKFRDKKFVRIIEIDPSNDEPLDDEFDVIFCMTVFEHLPRPIPVIKHLHSKIKLGGYLIFDYIKSEAKGLDTASSLRDRIPVLQYILDNFEITEGKILLDGTSVGTTVCKKV
jgi:2-polyprenyl-3-methyl-5-hydroxy-6-metoxy-1,4-benzoquinol methylase